MYKLNTAAFGRLCVETQFGYLFAIGGGIQPPSGGCVLKPAESSFFIQFVKQPPSGGCVLKQVYERTKSLMQFSRLRAAVC